MRVLAALAVVLGTASSGLAAPCERGHRIGAGEAAPCNGDLIPAEVLQKLLVIRANEKLLKLDLSECQQLRAIERGAYQERMTLEVRMRLAAERQLLESEPQWHESPVFWGVVGFVVGAGATAAVAVALK